MLRVYETGHVFSRTICRAFAAGVPDSQLVPAVALLDGDVATYGILRGTHEIINECKELGRTWWYIDHAYFHRSNHNLGKFDGYYRVTKNAYQHSGLGSYSSDRWDKLGISFQPWQRNGEHVMVCPMSYNIAVHLGLDAKKWLRDTVAEIGKHTNRTILIKPKTSEVTLEEALLDCHAIVGFDTNSLVDAIIMGIPAFGLGSSAADPVALNDLSKIESPIYPDRRQWCYNLCYNQYTLDELKDGTAWTILQENLDNNAPLVQRKRINNV